MNAQDNSLQTWCLQNGKQHLLNEWDYEKNGESLPSIVAKFSEKKVWWLGKCGHSWEATVGSRTNAKTGCPYCSGRKAIKGETDLMTIYPEIAEEWHPVKNGDLRPCDVTKCSGRKAWWLGKCGHEWQAQISNRVHQKSGCPICTKECHTSFPEQALIFYLRKHYSDVISSDTKAIGMELDIYIPSLKIAIEYDGAAWHSQHKSEKREIKKNRLCQENDILLIRIREKGLKLYDSCYCIVRKDKTNKSLSETIKQVFLDIDCISNVDVDIDRDYMSILNSYISYRKKNSLKALYPKLAKEWHPTRNEDIKPDMVSSGSNKKVWWLGKCGHEWQAAVSSRTKGGNGCPCCNNQIVVRGFNDLASANPDFLQEWNYDKNAIKPTEVTSKSDKKVWWKCQSCGYQWQTSIGNRSRGHGCPECGKIKQRKNKTQNLLQAAGSLEDKYPELAKEWHPSKNEGLNPCDITVGSDKKVWWRCNKCGHEWQATVGSRTRGNGCPECGKINQGKSKIRNLVQAVGSLDDKRPELVKEWHSTKNGDLRPCSVTLGSHKKAWWRCHICGFEWQAEVKSRALNGYGCPQCDDKSRCKSVMCVETGIVYIGLKDAENKTGIKRQSIGNCCNGRQHTSGGYHWKYIEE